ncbi:hypothetical protein HU200_018087 [Digitaria exilis]|uniref:Uncharacterized protein n=1 Tax=Digitaria exilis TaxID=1010633 RepID=A0A835KH91_9POAL|nr:hypothetical protein HU200_018087 [Digitaria exilis]
MGMWSPSEPTEPIQGQSGEAATRRICRPSPRWHGCLHLAPPQHRRWPPHLLTLSDLASSSLDSCRCANPRCRLRPCRRATAASGEEATPPAPPLDPRWAVVVVVGRGGGAVVVVVGGGVVVVVVLGGGGRAVGAVVVVAGAGGGGAARGLKRGGGESERDRDGGGRNELGSKVHFPTIKVTVAVIKVHVPAGNRICEARDHRRSTLPTPPTAAWAIRARTATPPAMRRLPRILSLFLPSGRTATIAPANYPSLDLTMKTHRRVIGMHATST